MPDAEQTAAAPITRASSESVDWVRQNFVIVAAVALIGVQLCWKAYLLSHFYFRQDDFQLMDQALATGFNLRYLFTINGGHLMPGGLAIAWAMVQVSLYDWTLASVVNLVLLAASGFALLRLLLMLFGRRPAILVPLTIYLFTPLMLPGLSFWTTTLLWLPQQLAILLALGSHVRYVRSGRIGHAIAAAAWLAAGMLFDEQGVLVPALVFALTSAYLVPGRWAQAAGKALRTYWRAWAIYGALTVGYVVLFLLRLQSSVQRPEGPRDLSSVLALASTMLRAGFIPAALGGPWHWYAPDGTYGFAAETPVLTQLSWVIAALIIGASLWYGRRRAWRAWAILAAWLLLADFAPLVISRLNELPAALLGTDLHYLADSGLVLAICVGLAFWPVIGADDAHRAPGPPAMPLALVTCVLVGGFFVSSMWSGAAYLNDTSSAAPRSYIANARLALERARPGTVIVSGVTPSDVMFAGFLGSAAQTSRLLGPLAPRASRIRFTTAPEGAIASLMIFDGTGRLRPAVDVGWTSTSRAGKAGCWPVAPTTTTIPLKGSVFDYGWIVQLRYSGPETTMQLRFGTTIREVMLPAGKRVAYVPVVGEGSAVLVRQLSPGPSACISSLTVGLLYALKTSAVLDRATAGRHLADPPASGYWRGAGYDRTA